jgi:phosphopantetheinyl transferase
VIRLVDRLSEWDGTLPGVLTAERATPEGRRALLRALAARTLHLPLERVEVEHGAGRPPRVVEPIGSGLFVSAASRNGFAALAVARAPVGVDVEVADPDGSIPWNVLHPIEEAMLEPLAGLDQAMAFARLWSLKEAYLKALAIGLEREPSSFVVQFASADRAVVTDPEANQEAEAVTFWRGRPEGWAAISLVTLGRPTGAAAGGPEEELRPTGSSPPRARPVGSGGNRRP